MPLLEQKRLFVAIALPLSIKETLEDLQKELRRSGPDAKWVEPENIHLTLKFLGSTAAEKIPGINSVLEKGFSLQKCFEVTLDRLGCFPSLNSPRILWAGFEDRTGAAKKIAALVEDRLEQLGFNKETREFQMHATLGRLRSSRNKIALIENIQTVNRSLKPQSFALDNITLFESKLSPQGPTYSIIHQVKFR